MTWSALQKVLNRAYGGGLYEMYIRIVHAQTRSTQHTLWDVRSLYFYTSAPTAASNAFAVNPLCRESCIKLTPLHFSALDGVDLRGVSRRYVEGSLRHVGC